MNASFPIRIQDSHQLLSELDLCQIENIVWLQLCPIEEQVVSVRFEVVVAENSGAESSFKAICKTELESGAIVETVSVASNKVDAIVGLGKKLWTEANSRLRFEQTSFYRCLSATSIHLRRIGSAFSWAPGIANLQRRQAS